MDIGYPVILFWVLLIYCVWSRGPGIYYLFFASFSFESVAAIPPQLLGGVSLTPMWITAGFLAMKVFLTEGVRESALAFTSIRRVGLMTICTAYGIISALIFPRLFAGQVEVVPMRSLIRATQPLGPSNQNFTQTLYFALAVLVIAAFTVAFRRADRRIQILDAALFGAAVAVATGLVDFVASQTGAASLLAPFRTATYTLLTGNDNVIADSGRRVVGLTPEPSAYAALCMGFMPILLLRDSFRTGFTRAITVPVVVVLLVLVIWLSKSSSGYIGLAVFGAVICLDVARSMALLRKDSLLGLTLIYLCPAIFLAVVIFMPNLTSDIAHIIDVTILQKQSSDSYVERSYWTRVTYEAFVHTWGFGAGLGSARASSWPTAVLGNIGIVGAVLMIAYLAVAFFSSGYNDHDNDLATAAKLGLIPMLVMGTLAGTTVGFGLGGAWLFGLIHAVLGPSRKPATDSPDTLSQWGELHPAPTGPRA